MVSHAIVKQFDGTVPRIGDISRKLGVSVRSLQSQLQQERTTFQELLAAVRRGMAESMLRNRSLSIGEIAYALGFSDPVAFHNAFKKWTGQTAGSYRKMDSFPPVSPGGHIFRNSQ
ncbi:helix-turn-helix transcriptional regulator [Paenibacillus cymbidii]|uniref:helix-turn-helix transcriptional regulator n=1 Tax=Paenibacillus cymbidii TaxID=1639034 RepID=UPI0010816474|nr:helix-turn-helix transcriptional regulator [Paenibacillus cymbidii]